MKTAKITYKSNHAVADRCKIAESALSRMIGLLNRKNLQEGEGLLIVPCKQVHTLFMQFAIDAIFLTRDNEIIDIAELRPWRVSRFYFKAHKVLETPLGTAKKLGLAPGDRLELSIC